MFTTIKNKYKKILILRQNFCTVYLHPPIVVLWPACLAVNEITARRYKLAIGLSELDRKCLYFVCLFHSLSSYCH
jgi:hypothetical protein